MFIMSDVVKIICIATLINFEAKTERKINLEASKTEQLPDIIKSARGRKPEPWPPVPALWSSQAPLLLPSLIYLTEKWCQKTLRSLQQLHRLSFQNHVEPFLRLFFLTPMESSLRYSRMTLLPWGFLDCFALKATGQDARISPLLSQFSKAFSIISHEMGNTPPSWVLPF